MNTLTASQLHNGGVVRLDDVLEVTLPELRDFVFKRVAEGLRIASLFVVQEAALASLYAVLADDSFGALQVARARIEGNSFESLTPQCPQAHWFEREIAEQYGIIPEGHPWLKPIRFHSSYRPGADAWGRPAGTHPTAGVTDFFKVAGDEVHEVAVGPVHAGVIEPGHFRFQCHGENVFHLEISLGYQHRGIEPALIGGPHKKSIFQIEALAGDTTIGHTTAFCQAIEALSGCQVPARAHAVRAIALELERLANHTGDLGALAGDTAFLPTASYCGRIRGDFLNMTALICGNRFENRISGTNLGACMANGRALGLVNDRQSPIAIG